MEKINKEKYKKKDKEKVRKRKKIDTYIYTKSEWWKPINEFLGSYQVIKREQAGVLSQQIGAKLSSTQRQEDARQGNTLLRSDLKHGGKESSGS